jgi:protein-S-isoprenylcysteine O-methyltransferase Ste14
VLGAPLFVPAWTLAWPEAWTFLGAFYTPAGVPLALGSFYGLLAVILLKLVIMWRLLDEEKLLAHGLAGYEAYRERVRYRLVPLVW